MTELWKKLKKQFKMSDLTTQTFYDFFKEYENKRISEFLKSWDYMMERIEFHTENPDSELMDEVSEEYKKWEQRSKNAA